MTREQVLEFALDDSKAHLTRWQLLWGPVPDSRRTPRVGPPPPPPDPARTLCIKAPWVSQKARNPSMRTEARIDCG
jgi:hypothetical protein